MTEETKVVNSLQQPVHITLTKNAKGYNWEVSVHGESVGDTIYKVEQAERELKDKYGGGA